MRAPAADVVGRREVGDVARPRRSWRSRPGCRPRGSCRGRAAASMRSRQVSLPRLRWRTTPGSSEPGARRLWAMRLQGRDLVQHRRPAVVRRSRRRGLGRAGGGLDDGEDLPAVDRVARRPARRSAATTPAQGAVTDVSIFMALTTNSRSPAFTGGAFARLDLDDRARMRAFDRPRARSAPAAAGQAARSQHRGRDRGLPPAGRGTAARPTLAVAAPAQGLGQQRGARVARPERRDGPGWRAAARQVGRQAGDVELVERAAACGRPPRRSVPDGARLADHLGEQRDRTAAAARSPR